jgi:tetratricopeptide (TPR) repeat protein
MSVTEPSRQLPANPNLTQIKRQAKELKSAVESRDPDALGRVRLSHPAQGEIDVRPFTLRDAQVTIAREYGFEGWHQLSTHVGEQMVDQRDLHRWFGVQLNNDMWATIEDDTVNASTPRLAKERALYAAYASAYHWRIVGDEANFARGEHLVSRVAARLGEADLALRHARRCLELVESHPDVMEDWDIAFAHEALARSLAAVGEREGAIAEYERASKLAEELSDPADREILKKELRREPWFDLIQPETGG